MRTVVSLGGMALLSSGERADAAVQRRHVRPAARAIAPLAVDDQLLLCHGNGRQVSLLALERENDETLTRPYPLDVLGAQTQGMIGYLFVQELRHAGVARHLAAVVTQAVVDRDDPGFRAPSAFVGPAYIREQIQLWAGELGWRMAHDGREWRRVVLALNPVHLLELPMIAVLVEADALVVCGGGGGCPSAPKARASAGWTRSSTRI
jgi:carbamate kinase